MTRLMVAAAWCGAAALALAGCTGSDGSEEELVVGPSGVGPELPVAGSFEIRAVAAEASALEMPAGAVCAPAPLALDDSGWVCDGATLTGYLVEPASITAADVASVSAWANKQPGMTTWEVSVKFTPTGAATFEAFTTEVDAADPPGNKMVILVGGKVVSAPTVQGPIAGGEAMLSVIGGEAEAQVLAAAIAGPRGSKG